MSNSEHSSPPAIKVNEVYYTYHDGIEALKGVSLSVEQGEKIGLVGANGAGKSTLLTLLIGIRLQQRGMVEIMGHRLTAENRRAIRRHCGLVFQDPDDQLFCPTVFDDVAFAPLNLGFPAGKVKSMVADALLEVDLAGYERRSSFHLSFGERKRLALATVLAYSPDIILIDEPSGNLDPRHRRQAIRLLQRLPRTMLIATHDLDLVLDVCQRCIIMNSGCIVAAGNVEEILTDERLLMENSLELPLSRQK